MKKRNDVLKISIIIIFLGFVLYMIFLRSVQKEENQSHLSAYHNFIKGSFLVKKDSVNLKVGEYFLISLPFTEGNGYSWYQIGNLKEVELIEKKVFDLNNSEQDIKDENRKIGGQILFLWKFKAVEKGNVYLLFKYYRHWEGEDKSARQKTYHLNIQ